MIQKIQKLKSFLGYSSAIGALVAMLAVPGVVGATAVGVDPDLQGNLCGGANSMQFGATGDCADTGEAQDTVNDLVGTVLNVFSIVVGIIAVIMIIFGGFKYITSGGDSGNISSAKTTILFAIVGLVIVAMAQIIVRFVLARATGNAAV